MSYPIPPPLVPLNPTAIVITNVSREANLRIPALLQTDPAEEKRKKRSAAELKAVQLDPKKQALLAANKLKVELETLLADNPDPAQLLAMLEKLAQMAEPFGFLEMDEINHSLIKKIILILFCHIKLITPEELGLNFNVKETELTWNSLPPKIRALIFFIFTRNCVHPSNISVLNLILKTSNEQLDLYPRAKSIFVLSMAKYLDNKFTERGPTGHLDFIVNLLKIHKTLSAHENKEILEFEEQTVVSLIYEFHSTCSLLNLAELSAIHIIMVKNLVNLPRSTFRIAQAQIPLVVSLALISLHPITLPEFLDFPAHAQFSRGTRTQLALELRTGILKKIAVLLQTKTPENNFIVFKLMGVMAENGIGFKGYYLQILLRMAGPGPHLLYRAIATLGDCTLDAVDVKRQTFYYALKQIAATMLIQMEFEHIEELVSVYPPRCLEENDLILSVVENQLRNPTSSDCFNSPAGVYGMLYNLGRENYSSWSFIEDRVGASEGRVARLERNKDPLCQPATFRNELARVLTQPTSQKFAKFFDQLGEMVKHGIFPQINEATSALLKLAILSFLYCFKVGSLANVHAGLQDCQGYLSLESSELLQLYHKKEQVEWNKLSTSARAFIFHFFCQHIETVNWRVGYLSEICRLASTPAIFPQTSPLFCSTILGYLEMDVTNFQFHRTMISDLFEVYSAIAQATPFRKISQFEDVILVNLVKKSIQLALDGSSNNAEHNTESIALAPKIYYFFNILPQVSLTMVEQLLDLTVSLPAIFTFSHLIDLSGFLNMPVVARLGQSSIPHLTSRFQQIMKEKINRLLTNNTPFHCAQIFRLLGMTANRSPEFLDFRDWVFTRLSVERTHTFAPLTKVPLDRYPEESSEPIQILTMVLTSLSQLSKQKAAPVLSSTDHEFLFELLTYCYEKPLQCSPYLSNLLIALAMFRITKPFFTPDTPRSFLNCDSFAATEKDFANLVNSITHLLKTHFEILEHLSLEILVSLSHLLAEPISEPKNAAAIKMLVMPLHALFYQSLALYPIAEQQSSEYMIFLKAFNVLIPFLPPRNWEQTELLLKFLVHGLDNVEAKEIPYLVDLYDTISNLCKAQSLLYPQVKKALEAFSEKLLPFLQPHITSYEASRIGAKTRLEG